MDCEQLLNDASDVYKRNFPSQTWFGRCIFLSWYCDLGTCTFCFRSTTKHQIRHASKAKRTKASIITDAIIGKNLGWPIEFLTGGYRIFDFEEMLDIAKIVSEVYQQKIWINLGTLESDKLEMLKPYVEGVCASIETVEPHLHAQVCPDKPIEPYETFLEEAEKEGFKKAITIVIGLGEKKEDFDLLASFIEKHKLDRITFYALKPVQGTPFTKSPEPEYYAWWIAKTRIRFPKLQIMAGLTPKNVEYTKLILRAGANGITKFPAVKQFGSEKARRIEQLAKDEGREFQGSLTQLPKIDWDSEAERLDITPELKDQVKEKLKQYLKGMNKTKETIDVNVMSEGAAEE